MRKHIRYLGSLWPCLLLPLVACGKTATSVEEAPPAKVMSSKSTTAHFGLWVQDEAMMQDSPVFKEALKNMDPPDPKGLLGRISLNGYLFSAEEVHVKTAGNKPVKHAEVLGVSEANGEISLEVQPLVARLDAKSGKTDKVTLKVQGDILTLSPSNPEQPPSRYRRCDEACVKKMDAGERVLFGGH